MFFGEYNEAIKLRRSVVDQSKSEPFTKKMCYYALKDDNNAITFLIKSIEGDKDNGEAYYFQSLSIISTKKMRLVPILKKTAQLNFEKLLRN